jgi:gliding motility-associated-like protein
LSFEDTNAPDVSACSIQDATLEQCATDTNQTVADNWNATNISDIQNCATDACADTLTVTSDYDFSNIEPMTNGETLTVEYTITDECGNSSSLEATINFINGANVITNDLSICVSDESENQSFDLFTLLEGNFTGNGTWSVVSGETILDGSEFSPLNSGLELITLNYTEDDSLCPIDLDINIDIHNRCGVASTSGVLACGDDLQISKVVTPNGDGINDVFEVNGIENCNFTLDLKIVNRWGALVYENKNYKNNWFGSSTGQSFGGANHLPNGTYYYILNIKNSGIKTLTGPIYLGIK